MFAAWTELKSLTDELFHPLIDAMVAADVPAPNMIGDDIVKDGRVVGMDGIRLVVGESCSFRRRDRKY